MFLLVDSPEARSTVARLLRAKKTYLELVNLHAPMKVLVLARLNMAKLRAEFELLPRRQAA